MRIGLMRTEKKKPPQKPSLLRMLNSPTRKLPTIQTIAIAAGAILPSPLNSVADAGARRESYGTLLGSLVAASSVRPTILSAMSHSVAPT